MRKKLFIFTVLLVLSIATSILSVILVSRLYECPPDGRICPLIARWVWRGFPFNVLGGPFDPNIMFVANVVFYFLVFSGIYFAYLKLFKKEKGK